MTPILTCHKGDNSDVFPLVMELYGPKGPGFVLDMTYGKGVFWKKMENLPYDVVKNDLDPERGDFSFDFTRLPEEWAEWYDVVVLDPPYLGVGGIETLKESIDKNYNNKDRAKTSGAGVSAVRRLYAGGMLEAHRVLKKKGVLILKTMDQVESGQAQFLSHDLMELGRIIGFKIEDEFILMINGTPTMRHETQEHARKNHSCFVVMRKRG